MPEDELGFDPAGKPFIKKAAPIGRLTNGVPGGKRVRIYKLNIDIK